MCTEEVTPLSHFLLWDVFCYCSYQHLAMIKLQKYLSMAFGGIGAPQKRKEKKDSFYTRVLC